MDLLSPKTIKELLVKYDAAPLKRLGQNFLINHGVRQKIIQVADLGRGDMVLEIGPGLGTLTQALAGRAKKVIAIEKDKKFVAILKETLKGYDNVKIIQNDILKFDIESLEFDCKLKIGNWKLIANLPYYITSPVIRKFLENTNRPKEMLLMVQKEVAQRICSNPPDMSLLAVSVQFYANPQIISYVSKGSFWPAPKVDSAILRLTPQSNTNLRMNANDTNKFFNVVRAGFSAPRKQLAGNLAKNLKIEHHIIEKEMEKARIEPSRRAETLTIEEWIKLAEQLT
jgi:16S rRNA (adenine1518-N6/adenine1519-N6)-dimethyltransferase